MDNFYINDTAFAFFIDFTGVDFKDYLKKDFAKGFSVFCMIDLQIHCYLKTKLFVIFILIGSDSVKAKC